MRLDNFTIGSEKPFATHQYKNLKNVTIDFDQNHWVTVMIGWNGTGKSNVLEALAIIFRDLIAEKGRPAFAFKLAYQMGSGPAARQIHIDADPERSKDPYIIHVATSKAVSSARRAPDETSKTAAAFQPVGERIKYSEFLSEGGLHLPKYVFSYYSGESPRMKEVFQPYLKEYDEELRSGNDPGLKRLFFAMPVHSQFVLLAFLIQTDKAVREVLEEHLGLDPKEGLESVLLVLREPPWKSKAADGDPRVWNARGIVRDFLARVYEIALAPIELRRRVRTSPWNTTTLQFKYLYIKDIAALRKLVGKQAPAKFFRDLESTHVSQLLEEVRIRVRLLNADGTVTFRELSEGEQQLLTVLGLLRFTAEDESLFLLDEPDTHLNPRWCVEYLNFLRKFVGSKGSEAKNSHIVLTTHNPIAIAELVKEQVQILQTPRDKGARRVVASHPEVDPRGMGYAAIVTSEMFGIASTLDTSTQLLLEQQRVFGAKKKLTKNEQEELDQINKKLDRLGFQYSLPDDEYSRYLRLRNDALAAQFKTKEVEAIAGRAVSMNRGERETLAARLVSEIVEEESKKDGNQ